MNRKAEAARTVSSRKSSIGRPRVLTDAQVVAILEWRDAIAAWKSARANIKTIRRLAADLGVTHGAVTNVIRRQGVLKKVSPEHRDV
jgi:hypothetical protein